MCGIAGEFGIPEFDVEAALRRLRHRGPDGSGIERMDGATLGHVRLALLDLSDASAQPFRRGDGWLTFNGEVWNYAELRGELEAEGEVFRTSGDTEVLAAALSRWGPDAALDRIEGMLSFAWVEGEAAILARDRWGEVPLYVHRSGDGFAWASERKGLGRDRPASPLPPGSILDLRTGKVRRWYRQGAGDAGARVIDLLARGVRRRLVADAPLCCLISGGLDSALVLALAQEAKPDVVAYTAVLDPRSPDLRAARRLCEERQVRLVEVPVEAPDAERLAAAARSIEIPSKAQVEIAALCIPLAERIGADGFKACLSGEAADELFGGYGSMCIKGSKADDEGWRAIRAAAVAKMARGNFVRCNKAFMAGGVECRLPFIETGLVERVLAMGKAECPPGKKALKRAAAGVAPEWIIRRQKETFQGGAGMDVAAAAAVASPASFYRAEVASAYGQSAVARPQKKRAPGGAGGSRKRRGSSAR